MSRITWNLTIGWWLEIYCQSSIKTFFSLTLSNSVTILSQMDVNFKFKFYTCRNGLTLFLHFFWWFFSIAEYERLLSKLKKSIWNQIIFNFLIIYLLCSLSYRSLTAWTLTLIKSNREVLSGILGAYDHLWHWKTPIKHNQTTDLLTPLKRAKPTKKEWGDTPEEQCEYIIKNGNLWKTYQIYTSTI